MKQVLKIGSDYLTNVTINSIEIGEKKNRAVFEDENHAKKFIELCKYFTNEEIKMISLEEDNATNFFNGLSLEEILAKTKNTIYERGKALFEKGKVVSVRKLYSLGIIKYECDCKSDSTYETYRIVFELDKDKKYLKHSCSCAYCQIHTQLFCKHAVACALAILDY